MSNSPGSGSLLAPGLDEISVLVELDDLRVPASMSLDHVDLARRSERHVVRFVEQAQMAVRVHFAGRVPHAQHERHASLRTHFVDHVGSHVGRPDVVLGVDAQPVRAVEQAIAQRANEFSARIELHQRAGSAMQHENVPLGIDRDARRAAERHAGRQLETVGDRDMVERRRRGRLRENRYGHQRAHQQGRERYKGLHISTTLDRD